MEQQSEVWTRLASGRSLEDLELPTRAGRYDLSNLSLPDAKVTQRFTTITADVRLLSGTPQIIGAHWNGLDFTDSRLNRVHFLGSRITNCIFDKSSCQDWGLWRTTVKDTSFVATDLRRAALGAVQDGARNSFRRVDFSEANLTGTAYTAAEFVSCRFSNTKLDKVDFATSTFTDCTFEGKLEDVIFNRTGFGGEQFPANEMVNVDFSGATLRFVEFRGLDLDRIQLPSSADHLVISNYKDFIDTLRVSLAGEQDMASRKLAAYLGVLRKWAGPNQRKGVLNVKDIDELAGRKGLSRVLNLYRKSH